MNDLTALTRKSPMSATTGGPDILVIGGGASGVLAALHLLSHSNSTARVTIAEPRGVLGQGIAFATRDPEHLLNTRVQNMSAFPGDADHFRRWLNGRPEGIGKTNQSFVSRETYGAYLSDLLAPWLSDRSGRLRVIAQTCIGLDPRRDSVTARLEDGTINRADLAILATGHTLPAGPQSLLANPWASTPQVNPEARVVTIGSGLTMVDHVLTLLASGHRGEIIALSRRSLLPQRHIATHPLAVTMADLPFGGTLSQVMVAMRRLTRLAEAEGGSWRDAIDGARPHVSALWRSLSYDERARFLRHAATLWDVHRHRMPPESAERIEAAMAAGQLKLVQGHFVRLRAAEDGGRMLTYRTTRDAKERQIAAAAVIDCRGIRRDPIENATPLLAELLTRRAARIDPLGLGLDVGSDNRLIDAAGVPSSRVYAIGPASRAAFWEITAVPDIRDQAARLASDILEDAGA